jgi:histidinol dehydrogenase
MSLSEGLLAAGTEAREHPLRVVRRILDDVRARGDAALLEHEERLDRCRMQAQNLRVKPQEIRQARARCPRDLLKAMRLAAGRIRRFQKSILLRAPATLSDGGRSLGLRYRPVDSAGIYIPGGTAPLASTLLMTTIPARVAGVRRIAVATPPRPDGSISDDRLTAAHIAGVTEIYRMGGAQAIAAFAFGTESVPKVDFIAGPGNVYVTLAKKEVFGHVGVEMLPGPSEVVIIADRTAKPGYVAADMLAQAEHNPASSVLLTDQEALAQGVLHALDEQLADLPRAAEARACLQAYGAVIVCRSLDECVELANEIAPEHLEILAARPRRIAARVRHAAAIFLGPWTPTAAGDYVAGPSHVLPTGGAARFASGLCANDFLKRSSIMQYSRTALLEDASAIQRLARAEGLDGHGRSVEIRTKAAAESAGRAARRDTRRRST